MRGLRSTLATSSDAHPRPRGGLPRQTRLGGATARPPVCRSGALNGAGPPCRPSAPLGGVRRRLPEVVDLVPVVARDLARDRPQVDRLVALVAVRSGTAGRGPGHRARLDPYDLVAKAHRER